MHAGPEDWREAARRALPRFVFDFLDGGAESEACMARNRRDLEAVTLTPRVLTDTRSIDTRVEVFGRTWTWPLGITPSGFNGLLRPGGDALLAQAAQGAGVPFVVATPSNQRLEVIRGAAPGAMLWLQLHVMEDRGIAEQMLRRARALDFHALVLTVDVPVSGKRERDLRNGLRLPLRWRPQLVWDVLSHPRWALRQATAGLPGFVNLTEDEDEEPSAAAQAALLVRTTDRSLVWDDLRWLRRHWPGPIVIKGLLHAEDARLALSAGADAITVSNHGGRQLNAAPSSISALPAIVDAVAGRVPVFVDSGFRRGSEVATALALGAHAVFFGRSLLYALAADGGPGVSSALRQLGQDFETSLALLGARDASQLAGASARSTG